MLVKLKKYYIDPFEIIEMYPEEYEKPVKDRKVVVYRLMAEFRSGSTKGYDFETMEERKETIKEIVSIRNKID